MHALDPLKDLVGRERSVRGLCQTLHLVLSGLGAPAIGAMHVTCADESEHECASAFQHGFAQYVLPSLKSAHTAPFRLANLGGRYEWGAARIAEDHYATEASRTAWKLVVVKVNAHAGVVGQGSDQRFGVIERYGQESACCGAIREVLEDEVHPFVDPLEEALKSEGKDRIAMLLDEGRVLPRLRGLYAALVSARLQARQVMLDVQDHVPHSPTFWVVLPCATINRPGPDTEILVGCYVADHREGKGPERYFGLGDDPTAYRLAREHDLVVIEDDNLEHVRDARDHRHMALSTLRTKVHSSHRMPTDARLHRIRRDMLEGKHRHHEHSQLLLKAALLVLGEIAPIPVAMMLFGSGIAGIHHAFKMHKLAHQEGHDDEARRIVKEIHDRVDELPPDEAGAVLEHLLKDHPA